MTQSIQEITVLGATGSVGASTLDIVARYPERYKLFALTAHTQAQKLFDLCVQFTPRYAVVQQEKDAQQLQSRLIEKKLKTEVLFGSQNLVEVAKAREVDIVMAAIVGAAGLAPTLQAVKAGKKVLLANKEALVMAGKLFVDAVEKAGATLLPIDSEHNAIFQALPHPYKGYVVDGVEKILLTASGGPFRGLSLEQLQQVTPEQACKHPNWSMGRKISVDSATLMNKGLEVIEAHWLFNIPVYKIEVVVHPQSIIHSMVQYLDGSVIAQMGNPDMRTPIAHALAYPDRIEAGVKPLDCFALSGLTFERPNEHLFPCLSLARQALIQGGTAPAILNAANEIAVEAFLEQQLGFMDIPNVVEQTLNACSQYEANTLDALLEVDSRARYHARTFVNKAL